MDWAERMVSYAAGLSYFASSHEGVPDDGTRSCPVDASPSSYCYGSGLYDYDETGLTNRFPNIVHAANQPLWHGCTQSQLGVVVELVDIKDVYSSRAIVEHMTWHATHQTEEGSMCHPSDAEVWKHFDRMYLDFAEERRNIRLGLCRDGFVPHGQYSRSYSY
ncbi:UNVERIFIED_CONTAM: hypothetical protein Sradi_5532600 [Sesamum radiatum]|uniref:Uncharacterized protein n=1 Tax=Sesamum radiatum TaxID=300843 RepID=A0AAW2LBS0_SESRA